MICEAQEFFPEQMHLSETVFLKRFVTMFNLCVMPPGWMILRAESIHRSESVSCLKSLPGKSGEHSGVIFPNVTKLLSDQAMLMLSLLHLSLYC